MWKGKNYDVLFESTSANRSKWNAVGDGNWRYDDHENGQYTALTSFKPCIRFLECQVDPNSLRKSFIITFSCSVKGEPPKTNDPYLLLLKVIDNNNNVIC